MQTQEVRLPTHPADSLRLDHPSSGSGVTTYHDATPNGLVDRPSALALARLSLAQAQKAHIYLDEVVHGDRRSEVQEKRQEEPGLIETLTETNASLQVLLARLEQLVVDIGRL